MHLVERPDQIVPIVCGGLGSLHAIALPSFGESQMQSTAPWCARRDDGSRSRRARRSTSSAGFLRADGADLLLREANPKTARVHLRSCSTASRAPTASSRPDELPGHDRRRAASGGSPGEFELVLDDPRRDCDRW